jgi:glycosyltransferase involved in cell wall biosynthesis
VISPDPTVVSVIIACLNGAETLADQLDALARQEWFQPWELIVSDNGSTDGTVALAERYRDRLPLRIVDASHARGNARARNAGARAARAPKLVFCDQDDEVADGWLAAVADGLEQHEIVSCRVDVDRLNSPALRDYRPHTSGTELPRVPFPPYMPYAATCSLGFRTSTFEELGGFDESVPSIPDDDISIRAHLAGKDVVLLEAAVVHYRHRERLPEIYRQARSYTRDWALFQKRYGDPNFRVSRSRWLLQGWRWIFRALPGARRQGGRAKVAWMLGCQIGRYQGSRRHGVRSIV